MLLVLVSVVVYHFLLFVVTVTAFVALSYAREVKVKIKVKVKWIYTAPSRETFKSLRHGSHSVTCITPMPLPRKRSPDGASQD